MRTKVISAPSPVVSREEAKAHLIVDSGDDDVYIDSLVAAATAWIDGPTGWLGRALGVQTLEARIQGFGCYFDRIALPCPPIIDVLSVKYLDNDDVEQTLDPSDYISRDGEIWTKTSFVAPPVSRDPLPVIIQYRAGYGLSPDYSVNSIPAPVKVAILLLVGQWYRIREPAVIGAPLTQLPFAVDALLSPYRVYR